MSFTVHLGIVLFAGLVTSFVCGLGALPFFVVDEFNDRWTVALWGLASGIMVAASLFGLIFEGLAGGTAVQVGTGVLAGAVLVLVSDRVIAGYEFRPREIPEADFRKILLIFGVLTVHSFPEGVAIGVAFADLGFGSGWQLLGVTIPALAVFMTIAISIQNIPEGLAVAIPLQTYGMDKWKVFGLAVFSSIPQPIGAGIAYGFVRIARELLPYGFGFAAGAMIFLVAHDMLPEALDHGNDLPRNGLKEIVIGLVIGIVLMLPLLWITAF